MPVATVQQQVLNIEVGGEEAPVAYPPLSLIVGLRREIKLPAG